jgi:hypothetical protein
LICLDSSRATSSEWQAELWEAPSSTTSGEKRLTFKTTDHDIEFVGGPFDGHTQLRDLPVTCLPVDVVWFVGNNVHRMLDEQEFESPQPLTSVALYERDLSRGRCGHRIVGAISV